MAQSNKQDHHELVRELGQVRERGIMRVDSPNPDLKRLDLSILRKIASLCGPSEMSFSSKLLDIISASIEEVPEGMAKKAATRLYGLDVDPTFPRPSQWRNEARKMYPLVGADDWRKGIEVEILGLIARNIEAKLAKTHDEPSLSSSVGKICPEPDLFGAAKSTVSGFHILGSLGRWLEAKRHEARMVKWAKELIGIASTDLYSYRLAMNHPLYRRGNAHPDDAASFHSIVSADVSRAMELGLLNITEDISVSLNDGMILIGSPEAEAVTRLVFGYESYSTDRGMRYIGNTIDLPYRWQEDRESVEATCTRYVHGKGKVLRPNWPVISNVGNNEKVLYPVIRNDGLLHSDFLLITKVPNFLTSRAYQSGRSIVSIAGSHGTGTRAINTLLNDRRVLATIGEQIPRGYPSFQILLEAYDITHDPARGSVAKKVRLVDVQRFERSDSSWNSAARAAAERRASWLEEVSGG